MSVLCNEKGNRCQFLFINEYTWNKYSHQSQSSQSAFPSPALSLSSSSSRSSSSHPSPTPLRMAPRSFHLGRRHPSCPTSSNSVIRSRVASHNRLSTSLHNLVVRWSRFDRVSTETVVRWENVVGRHCLTIANE